MVMSIYTCPMCKKRLPTEGVAFLMHMNICGQVTVTFGGKEEEENRKEDYIKRMKSLDNLLVLSDEFQKTSGLVKESLKDSTNEDKG